MNKKLLSILSILLTLTLVFAEFKAPVKVFGEEEKNEIESAVSAIADSIGGSSTSAQLINDNVMYVITDAAGTPEKAIFSDANGMTEQELASFRQPVDVTVTYTLNGKEVSADEIAGASGKVGIRFDYRNNEIKTVEIDGKEEEMFIPYVVVSGVILSNENFSDIEIVHGRLAGDGSRFVAGGIAVPGLKQNIDPDGKIKDLEKIPDYIEITANTTNFDLPMTISAVFALNLDELELGSFDGVTELTDGIDRLKDAMIQLVDGAGQLSDGSEKLSDGAAQLAGGIKELSGGLGKLSDNSGALRDGAAQVFNSLLSTVKGELEKGGLQVGNLTIGNYSKTLNKIIDSLDSTNVYNQALAQVTAVVEANRPQIKAAVTAAVKDQVTTAVKAAIEQGVRAQATDTVRAAAEPGVREAVITGAGFNSVAEYEAAVTGGFVSAEVAAQIEAAVASNLDTVVEQQLQTLITQQTDAQLDGQVEAQMNSDEIKAVIDANTQTQVEMLISQNMASEEVQGKLSAAAAGAKAVIAAKAQLDAYNSFYLGLKTYTNGVDAAASGSKKLLDGAGSLKKGASDLAGGMSELADGIKKLDDEGISKLTEKFDENTVSAIKRFAKVLEIAGDATDVKYIIRTASVEGK